jgi:hypothetical protein
MSEDFENPDVPRTAPEIARRALALHCVIAASHEVSKGDISKWLKDENLYEELSPWERGFMESPQNTERDIIQATWRVEGQVALLWAIKKIDRMDDPTGQCNTRPLVDAIPDLFTSTSAFTDSADLRGEDEISDAYEEIYEIHWRLRDSKRKGAPLATHYDSGVVQERHYALNWITGYCGQEWDEITTDT